MALPRLADIRVRGRHGRDGVADWCDDRQDAAGGLAARVAPRREPARRGIRAEPVCVWEDLAEMGTMIAAVRRWAVPGLYHWKRGQDRSETALGVGVSGPALPWVMNFTIPQGSSSRSVAWCGAHGSMCPTQIKLTNATLGHTSNFTIIDGTSRLARRATRDDFSHCETMRPSAPCWYSCPIVSMPSC